MRYPQLPFEPMRRGLYTWRELLDGFDPHDPATLTQALDYRIYRYWVRQGRYKPRYFDGMMQSLHDNAITQGVADFVDGQRVVAIMGGHATGRDSPMYRAVADLSRRLARAGLLVASGGGPGAMEAVHLGALHAQAPDADLGLALVALAETPAFPDDAGRLVARDGTISAAVRDDLVAWLRPAIAIARAIPGGGTSLGIPTWRYGHEPTSVFASHIAKYFENSVREDGLLSLAAHGLVYAPGSAGTLQEVFQDAVFNAYADEDRGPSPMVFFGAEHWTRIGVLPVLRELFGRAGYETFVTLTDDPGRVVAILDGFVPLTVQAPMARTKSGPARSRPQLRRVNVELPDDPA